MRLTATILARIAPSILSFLAFATEPRPAPSAQEIDKRVVALISKMHSRRSEHKAFADLEALGCAAVPSIIAHLDDMRTLPEPNMTLTNKWPGAWESYRFYGPKKIVDALAAILNQLTGEGFGSGITNGETTDSDRAQAVSEWRGWLSRTPPSKLCEGG